MLKAHFSTFCVSLLTPLILTSMSPFALAQLSPSRGTAGSISGNAPTGGSQTPISVPTTISAPGTFGGFQPVSANVTITPATTPGGQVTVTVPAVIATAVNAAGSNAVITFSTGSLSQIQIAALVSALSPTVANNINGEVPGGIVIESQSGGTTTSSQTVTTFAAAIAALGAGIAAAPPGGRISIQVGGIRVVISPRVAGGLVN
jgi:hypothetical protein